MRGVHGDVGRVFEGDRKGMGWFQRHGGGGWIGIGASTGRSQNWDQNFGPLRRPPAAGTLRGRLATIASPGPGAGKLNRGAVHFVAHPLFLFLVVASCG